MKVHPQLAPVRPRVRRGESGEIVRLEDRILAHCTAGGEGAICIYGPAGSGKTAALRHLAAVLNATPAPALLDDPSEAEVAAAAKLGLVVYAAAVPFEEVHVATYRLASWTDDDLIEYLLATHRAECTSVMARLRAAADGALPGGNPEVWRIVLDELAADEALPDVTAALRRHVEPLMHTPRSRRRAERAALELQCFSASQGRTKRPRLPGRRLGARLGRLMRLPPVQRMLAVDAVRADLHACARCAFLAGSMPSDLITQIGVALRADPPALEYLDTMFKRRRPAIQPMVASLLFAADPRWQLPPSSALSLRGAHLAGVAWPGTDLAGVILDRADLHGADLSRANLSGASARATELALANLRGAVFDNCVAAGADLTSADLSCAHGMRAKFDSAHLAGANLERTLLHRASFDGADLSGARLTRAGLAAASFRGATITDADFAHADLFSAVLEDLNLSVAEFAGATFAHANLRRSNLEGLRLANADFTAADLEAALLTGSCTTGACFRGAVLRATGLAEIDWERADLRDADLRGATFHMGSSRSGLVHSPYASEGTRTGFYTDEYGEQTFRAPEEIRKANLRGADLRGAQVQDVDFYLVDLRDAVYDADQAEHFRRCGAILESRV